MADADDPGEQIERALALVEVGRFDSAEEMLRRLLTELPDDPDVLAILGLLLSDLGRHREALEVADRALAGDPDCVAGHMARGHALLGLERNDDALAAAREAVRLAPWEEDTHQLVAVIHMVKGDWAEAKLAAERALELDPESKVALGLRAAALAFESGDSGWQEAARKTLAAAPHDAVAHTLTGVAHLYGRGERDAVEHFREALRLDPSDEGAQAGLATALKAAHPLFRPMFRFYLWQERLGTGESITIAIVGGIIARAVWNGVGGIVGVVVAALWIGFIVLSWAAVPIANLALRMSRVGRTILPAEEKRSSSVFALLIAAALVALPLILLNGGFVEVAFVFVMLALAAGSTHALTASRKRLVDRLIVGVALASVVGAVLIASGVEGVGAIVAIAALVSSVLLLWVVRLSS